MESTLAASLFSFDAQKSSAHLGDLPPIGLSGPAFDVYCAFHSRVAGRSWLMGDFWTRPRAHLGENGSRRLFERRRVDAAKITHGWSRAGTLTATGCRDHL